jgi:uncharacterized membrane protein YobD (UPF0266 family)
MATLGSILLFLIYKGWKGQDFLLVEESGFIYQIVFMNMFSKIKKLNINHCILWIIINIRAT